MKDTLIGLAPRFILRIGGSPLRLEEFMDSVTYEDNMEGASVIEISLQDPDKVFVDSTLFQEGNHIDLWMGYKNDFRYMNRAEIVEADITYPRDNIPHLTIRAFDVLHKMMDNRDKKKILKHTKKKNQKRILPREKKRKQSSRSRGQAATTFNRRKDSDIVKSIFRKYGLVPEVDNLNGRVSRIKVTKTSDYQFLRKLARINSCFFYVKFDYQRQKWVGYFKKRSGFKDGETYMYEYDVAQPTLLDFNPEMVMRKQASELEILAMDPIKKTPLRHKVTTKSGGNYQKWDGVVKPSAPISSGHHIVFQVYNRSVEIFCDKPFKNKKEAKKYLEGYSRDMADQFITGTGTVVGDPILRARRTMFLAGLGQRHSGVYEITQARHTMSPSGPYYTKVKVRRVIEPLVVAERRANAKRKGVRFCLRSPLHTSVCEDVFRRTLYSHAPGTERLKTFVENHEYWSKKKGYQQLFDYFNKLPKEKQIQEYYTTRLKGSF